MTTGAQATSSDQQPKRGYIDPELVRNGFSTGLGVGAATMTLGIIAGAAKAAWTWKTTTEGASVGLAMGGPAGAVVGGTAGFVLGSLV